MDIAEMKKAWSKDVADTIKGRIDKTLDNWRPTTAIDIDSADVETLRKMAEFQRHWLQEIDAVLRALKY